MTQNNSTEMPIDLRLPLQIPQSHACYADHFPGDPLVPGALLLKWGSKIIEENLNAKISHYKQIKFLSPVRPGDQLTIFIERANNSSLLSLSLKNQDFLVMKGQLNLLLVEQENVLNSLPQTQGNTHD